MSNLNIGGQIEFESIGEGAKQVLLDLFYPVNTLYLTDSEKFNPNFAWGGTWEQLDGGYSLMTTKKNYPYEWNDAAMDFIPNMNKEKVYEMSTHHADSHIPGTNVEGGLPNVVGAVNIAVNVYNGNASAEGALYKTEGGQYTYLGTSNNPGQQARICIDASKCANVYGLYQSGTGIGGKVIPEHHATIVWKRLA